MQHAQGMSYTRGALRVTRTGHVMAEGVSQSGCPLQQRHRARCRLCCGAPALGLCSGVSGRVLLRKARCWRCVAPGRGCCTPGRVTGCVRGLEPHRWCSGALCCPRTGAEPRSSCPARGFPRVSQWPCWGPCAARSPRCQVPTFGSRDAPTGVCARVKGSGSAPHARWCPLCHCLALLSPGLFFLQLAII